MTPYEEVIPNPEQFAEKAEKIYREGFQEKLEASNWGEYVAINPSTGKVYLGEDPMLAVAIAREFEEDPNGVYHLIRIGGTVRMEIRCKYPDDENPMKTDTKNTLK